MAVAAVTAPPVQPVNPLSTVYATKRRRRNGKSVKTTPKDGGVGKSNPSKRHRERLNAELDTLANLLPFEHNILSKLDRLSILRLSVSYLRTKSYFQVTMHKSKEEQANVTSSQYQRSRTCPEPHHLYLDGDMFLQALNGFLVMLTCDGEVFFATHTIENYLGFHQSDIVHQSVYELVHSEDREELQRQLMWNSAIPTEPGSPSPSITLHEALHPDNCRLLQRSFTIRFRCLLDNTSGFLRLDVRGRIKVIHGQNRKSDEPPPLGLFALCTPFGPPSLLEIPHKEVMFKSKHKLDLSLVSMDQRGKLLLGYCDSELANMGGYDLVHYDDLAYVASAHQELLKTGASGMIAYRVQTKPGTWQWLQTSSRLVYKNSKPDFVIGTHRPLMEEEGRDLLGKRTMDFKVSYLDAGLTNSYFSDSEQLSGSLTTSTTAAATAGSGTTGSAGQTQPSQPRRRYKTHLRDFLSTCRTKRKLSASTATPAPTVAATVAVEYPAAVQAPSLPSVPPPTADVLYTNLNTAALYSAGPYNGAVVADNGGYHQSNFHQTLYDTRIPYLTATDNLFQYRPLGNYYTEYHTPATTPYMGNGFLDISPRGPVQCGLPTYDQLTTVATATVGGRECSDKLYGSPPVVSMDHQQQQQQHLHHHHHHHQQQQHQQQQHQQQQQSGEDNIGKCHMDTSTAAAAGLPYLVPLCDVQFRTKSSSPPVPNGLKIEDSKSEYGMQSSDSDVPRQTVLMWGTCVGDSSSSSPPNQSPGGGGNGVNNNNGGGGGGVGGGVNGSGSGTGGGGAGCANGGAGGGASVTGNVGSGSAGGDGGGDPRTSPQINGHPPSPYAQRKKMSPPAPQQPPTGSPSDQLCKSHQQADMPDTPPSPTVAAAAAAAAAAAYANHHHYHHQNQYHHHHHQQHHMTGGPEVWTPPHAHPPPPPPPPHHFYAYHHHHSSNNNNTTNNNTTSTTNSSSSSNNNNNNSSSSSSSNSNSSSSSSSMVDAYHHDPYHHNNYYHLYNHTAHHQTAVMPAPAQYPSPSQSRLNHRTAVLCCPSRR
ncbi:aryl hydrocarbon receptor protein 1 isoform X2 [Metopolophium dirhodum]|uniref:aryl hydrocarbon receptor protein 1 isoform X2 n=1 Tax=Metopolophium dirhodum TaxID=44670 RepID=UPI00298FEB95|nr:aryl hydrocarbon receptor protein 1 isoform X2 [Metopolophium dirhodum]